MEHVPSRSRALVAFAVVLLLVVLDQWSKAAVFDYMASGEAPFVADAHGHRQIPVLGRWLSLMQSCNKGAAFGRLDTFPRVLVGGRILAVLFLSVLLWRADPRQRVVRAAMVLVLAGALGNVIDNLWTGCGPLEAPHGVRDFINVWFEPLISWDYHFPSFNVADSCITVGAVLWVLSGMFPGRAKEPAGPVDAGGEEAAG